MENINEAKSYKPFYFYHMTDKNNKVDKLGLISPEYMYQHNMDKELQLSYDKYRDRLVNGWGVYPGRDPGSLTNEEIYNGLKQFRGTKHGGTGNDEIYFFRYPPYRDLHPQIRSLLNDRVYYRIDINNPALKPYIKIIHWGWKDSHSANDELKRSWYEKVSVDEYFDQFDSKKQPLFSTLWHIKIVTTKGYIPAKFVERIETPNAREDVKRLEGEIVQGSTYNNLYILDINRSKIESVKYLKSKHSKYTKYIDNYNGEIIIDRDKDIIVGQVFVGKSGKDKGFITGLWVRDSYRRRGLGKKLLEDAIKKYNGIDLTVSKDNDAAINLYKTYGFANIKYNNDEYYWMKLKSKISEDDVLDEAWSNESYTPNTDYIESLEENLLINKKDIYYNIDKLEAGINKVLYITGFSGSGKSTLRRDILSKYPNTIGISLDHITFTIIKNNMKDVPNKWDLSIPNIELKSKIGPIVYEYLTKIDKSWIGQADIVEDPFNAETGRRVIRDFLNWLESKVVIQSQYKNNIFVVEGTQIYLSDNLDYFKGKSIIIKGTSASTSFMRRAKREWQYVDSWDRMKKIILSKIPIYFSDNKRIEYLKDVMNESSTNLLEESSYPDNIPDDIVTLSKELNSYDYGYIVNGKLADSSDDFFNDYRSLSISEFEKYKVGVCWDYVHYEANWFKSHRYKYETFYIQVQDEDGDCPSHTYLVFYLPGSNKPYYFEVSWKKYRGIEQFSSISKLHDTIKKRHIEDAESKCDPKTYINAKYDAASKSLEHIGCGEFMVKASNGRVRLSESINVKLPGSDIYYNSEYLEERYIGKMNDIYYNKDKFDSGEINLCFITGHSGSGKSTMARSMKKDNIEVYELDDVVYNKESFTMENLKEYGDLIYSFFNGPGKKYYFTKEDVDFGRARSIEAYDEKLIKDFIKYTITYAKSHKNNKFVVEGLWLLDFIEPELLKDYAVYIKGTSLLRSTIRAANRDSDYEKENGNSKLMGWIGRVRRITSFADCEKNLRKYQTYFSKLSCNESSIKRSEVNTSDFGLPDLRKYPMPDKDHVLSAIKFFNYVSPANEKELAKNIKKKMKQYNISPDRVGKKNRLRKYLTEDTDIVQELCFDSLDYTPILVFDIGDVLVYYKKKMIDAICSNKAIKYGEELWDYIIDTFNKNSKYLDCCSYNDYVKYMTNNAPTHLKQYITTALSIDINNETKFDYTDSLLRNLKSNGYPIYYLSNWSKWSRDALIKNGTFDFLKYFDGGIFSCDCGISKPDERIYKKLFEKYNLNPGHTIFFDDRYENISAAINCGMNGILFNHEYTTQWIKDYFLK